MISPVAHLRTILRFASATISGSLRLWTAGVLVTIIFITLSIARLWYDREADIEQWRSHLSDTSLILAEHVRQSLTAADLVLQSITDYVHDANIETDAELRSALGTKQIFEVLRNRASSVPQVSVASIVSRTGDIINFSRSWPPPPINVADRDYFKAHLADPDIEVFLSAPVRNRGNKKWTFYLARKIKNSLNETIGLTLTGLESAFFSDFYGRIINTPGSAVTLLRADGTVIARYPNRDDLIGASFASHPIFQAALVGNRSSATLITSEPNAAFGGLDTPRMISPRRVQGYPLVLNLVVMQNVILSEWWKRAYFNGTSTVLAALLLIGMTGWIARLLRRQQENLVALEMARNAAEAATLAKSEFLAHMSHEIRTPLNAVIGLANLLIGTPLDREQQNFVETIGRSGDYLLSLLNNVLDLSRLEAGHIDIEKDPIHIATLVGNAVATAQALHTGNNLEISASIDSDVPPVVIGDAGRITQILLNLLSNAIKYTVAGSVELRVARTDHGPDNVSVRFSVTDTGIGISPEDQVRLFDPFERGRNMIAKHAGGSGLGLAISRKTVLLLGGRIGVESRQGVGSTFWFELTLGIGTSELTPTASTAIVTFARSLNVLVAEDTPANQTLIRAVLEKMGHSVQVVANGAEAVEALPNGHFDVVLMDLQMPSVDGYEAARRIRNLAGQVGSIPIIGVTAYAGASDKKAVLQAGMNDYVSKPFRFSNLAAALARATSGRIHPLSGSHDLANATETLPFDVTVLETLLAAVGADTFRELIDDFEKSLNMLLAELETALAERDEQSIRTLVHRLIGMLGQFGGTAVVKAARALEFAEEAQLAKGGRDLIDRSGALSEDVLRWDRERRANALALNANPAPVTKVAK